MEYEWDENKRLANLKKHGVDFWSVYDFDWERARSEKDERRDYGETRWLATGTIKGSSHRLVYTKRGAVTRVIALRKTNKKESNNYEQWKSDRSY